jgi:hypothetical protein
VYPRALLTSKIRSRHRGQVIEVTEKQITIRLGSIFLKSNFNFCLRTSQQIPIGYPLFYVYRPDTETSKPSSLPSNNKRAKVGRSDIIAGIQQATKVFEARQDKGDIPLFSPVHGQLGLFKGSFILKSNKKIIEFDYRLEKKYSVAYLNRNVKAGELIWGEKNHSTCLFIIFAHLILHNSFSSHQAAMVTKGLIQIKLVQEAFEVYYKQGIYISCQHFEIIIRQMTSKVIIATSGSTVLLPGELLELNFVNVLCKATESTNLLSPGYFPVLLGITKVALSSQSFISAASFQHTTTILTQAAIAGKTDWLVGIKEQVIFGKRPKIGGHVSRVLDNQVGDKIEDYMATLIHFTPNIRSYILRSRLK